MTEASLGERELEIMAVLWETDSGTVSEVREHLDTPLAYTTVLTMLRNLEAKRFVRREVEGRGVVEGRALQGRQGFERGDSARVATGAREADLEASVPGQYAAGVGELSGPG